MKTVFLSEPKAKTLAVGVEIADYWGIAVEVLCRLEQCSLVRCRDQEFIVNSDDLNRGRAMRCAA